MSSQCKSCGAPLESQTAPSSVRRCDYCGTTSYVDGYIEAYLAKIDHPRVAGILDLAKAAFDGGDFEGAAKCFDDAIREDPSNYEAWAYKAVSLANTVRLDNLNIVPAMVKQSLAKAYELSGGETELVSVAETAASERIVSEIIRAAERRFEQALKVERGFSHNSDVALAKATPKAEDALDTIAWAFESPSSNITQMVQLSWLAAETANRYGLTSHSAFHKAQGFYVENKEKFPDVTAPLAAAFDPKPKEKRLNSCVLGSSLVRTRDGGLRRVDQLALDDFVETVDPDTGETGFSRLLWMSKGKNAHVVSIHSAGHCFTATSSHSILTNRGVLKLKDVSPGDLYLTSRDGGCTRWVEVRSVLTDDANKNEVFWYFTDSKGISIVDNVAVSEFSSFPRLQRAFLVGAGAWKLIRLLDAWFTKRPWVRHTFRGEGV